MHEPGRRTYNVLAGGGEMGALMRAFDWKASSLGSPDDWPQSLKTAVRIMLTSRHAMFVWWGRDLINLYNDAYRPILGARHPGALGRSARDIWAEIWDLIGPRTDAVLLRGEATYDENLLLLMARYGFREETYFTFSYSAISDDLGGTGGLFCAVTEDTAKVVGERQLALLRELAASTWNAHTVEDVYRVSASCLETDARDIPFALLYLADPARSQARLRGVAGIEVGHAAAPATISLDMTTAWPIADALRANAVCRVAGLEEKFGAVPCGAWEQAPTEGLVFPIGASGQSGPAGVLIAACNPHRKIDEAYRGFLSLIAAQIGAAVNNTQAYEQERQRAERLAELDRAKTQFFSNVSHEFRTPLTLMLSPIEEVLDKSSIAPADHRLLDLAHRNAMRLLKLVNTLLDFSRIEAGRVQARYAPTDLCAVTTDLASIFRSAMEKAGLEFIVNCEPLPHPLYVDAEMWEKIVLNLLSNAFKFTFEGRIEVRLRPSTDGKAAKLDIRDTGVGIPAQELPRLFERFHRIEGQRGRSFEGSGIGLALVQGLVKLHGGEISVESEAGRGSVFTVAIPFGSAHLPKERIEERPVAAPNVARTKTYVEEALRWLPEGSLTPIGVTPEHASPGALSIADTSDRKPVVLFAADNADMRDYVQRLLAGAGYAIELAANGREALEAAQRRAPDLVITDVMMPEVDGFGLLAHLRRTDSLATVPVLLLSARAGEEARIEGLAAGADDYLIKPFAARELLARVDTHLRLKRLREDAQAALRASEERYRLLIRASSQVVVTADATGENTDTGSNWWEQLTGQPLAESRNHGWLECVHPEDYETTAATWRGSLARQTPFDVEFRVRKIDGSYVWLHATGAPITGPDGAFREWAIALRDITRRKQNEHERERLVAELRRLNETLGAQVEQRTRERDRIWQVSSDLMAVAGVDGYLKSINPAWSRVLGYDETTLLSRPFAELIHPEDAGDAAHTIASLKDGKVVHRFEGRIQHQDGSYRWISWTAAPEGDIFYTIGRDVTEERSRAEELAGANRKLLTQIEEREQMEATLRQMQRLEAVGQLTSGVAHDFNNLLTVVLGNIGFLERELAQNGMDGKPLRRLSSMRMAAERGANLTAQLLAFSRRQRLEAKPLDLNETLAGMRDLLQSTMGGSIRIETLLRPRLWTALADPTQIELAVLNLAINARDAMQVGGSLTVETGNVTLGAPFRPEEPPAGDYVMISVTDTGTGMTDAVRAKVFEPFFTTKEVGKGSGLGLSQVLGFAKQSGGGVRLDTAPGAGASFKVYLPRATDAPRTAGAAGSADGVALRSATKVLVVDDDASVREVTASMLDELGYVVMEAGSGPAALELLAHHSDVDLAVVDFAMPGMNGAELSREARKLRSGLPVLFVTGYADIEALAAVEEEFIIKKPFIGDELGAKVRRVLNRSHAAPASSEQNRSRRG